MNIQHGRTVIQTVYEYDENLGAYRFGDDIKIGDWVVAKMVRIGGPRISVYKYDFKNYLEFVITDKSGESRTKLYYYNCFSDEITTTKTYDDDLPQRGVRLFLENHPIFETKDWEEYDAFAIVSKIEKVIYSEDEMSNLEKLTKIRNLLR